LPVTKGRQKNITHADGSVNHRVKQEQSNQNDRKNKASTDRVENPDVEQTSIPKQSDHSDQEDDITQSCDVNTGLTEALWLIDTVTNEDTLAERTSSGIVVVEALGLVATLGSCVPVTERGDPDKLGK
jgi:hypothetical protein